MAEKPATEAPSDLIEQKAVETAAVASPEVTAEVAPEPAPQKTPATASTLIEFPGAGRPPLPQWRRDLSERVREIQERRAREAAAREFEESMLATRASSQVTQYDVAPTPLGLVPAPADQGPINPLVANALRRLERARQPVASPRHRTGASAAVAVARSPERQFDVERKPETLRAAPQLVPPAAVPVREEPRHTQPVIEPPSRQVSSAAPAYTFVKPRAVKPEPAPVTSAEISKRRMPAEDIALDEQEEIDVAEAGLDSSPEVSFEVSAPFPQRIAAAVVDLIVVLFAASPFAAIIELTNANWADPKVMASMGGILLIVMFLYFTASVALSGRTCGMSLTSLRTIDVETGLAPSTGQSVRRTIGYMASLALLGTGVVYAFFDGEGRAAHDHISGTAVVQE